MAPLTRLMSSGPLIFQEPSFHDNSMLHSIARGVGLVLGIDSKLCMAYEHEHQIGKSATLGDLRAIVTLGNETWMGGTGGVEKWSAVQSVVKTFQSCSREFCAMQAVLVFRSNG